MPGLRGGNSSVVVDKPWLEQWAVLQEIREKLDLEEHPSLKKTFDRFTHQGDKGILHASRFVQTRLLTELSSSLAVRRESTRETRSVPSCLR